MVGRGREQREARLAELVEHPGRRAEMRAARLQRRIAAIVVGQHLEVGEGDVGCPHAIEQRLELGVAAALQAALQDGIAGENETKGHGGTLRKRRTKSNCPVKLTP